MLKIQPGRGLILLGLIALMAMRCLTWAQGLRGSSHDFSTATWNPKAELCLPCHTPHSGTSIVPLWNHQTTVAVFKMYDNTANTQDSPPAGQPSSISLACLSCHDGITALDAFGGHAGSVTIANALENYRPELNLGRDLSNDHPISIKYSSYIAISDGKLYDPQVALSGISPGGTIDQDMLRNGKVECSSCHDVHNKAGNSQLLRKENSGSMLCLTCHDI
jgi:predicted CXXCH cytochrome family protein